MPNEQFLSYIMARTSCITWNNDALLDLYRASSLEQQFTGKHVAPLEHII